VDQGGGLERVAGGFVCHLLRRKPTKFLVNNWKKFGGSIWITVFHPFQNVCELAQDFRIKASAPEIKRKRRVVIAGFFAGQTTCTLLALLRKSLTINGAGEGNRTLVSITSKIRRTWKPKELPLLDPNIFLCAYGLLSRRNAIRSRWL
jgi:hypothetical protein